MRNISRIWKGAGSVGLVLLAGLTSSTSRATSNAWPASVGLAEVLPCAGAEVSNIGFLQKSLAAKQLTQEQYRSEVAKLSVLDRAKDFDGLVKAGNDLEKRWGRSGGQNYARLMLEIANLLENHFARPGISATSQEYVSSALAKSESFPLWLEVMLLPFLSRDVTSAASGDSASWMRERRAKLVLWLHAWQRLEAGINRNFDFSDRPRLNISPPDETKLPAGIAPEGIRDPKLRAQYETALAANARKGCEYNRQFMLRYLDETFPKTAENHLIRVYSKPPYQTEELRRHLLTYGLNWQIRKRVLSKLKETSRGGRKNRS